MSWAAGLTVAANLMLALLPRSVLAGGVVVLFGGLLGAALAALGVLLSSAVLYGVGALLPRRQLRRIASAPLDRLGLRLLRARLGQLVTARWLPLAPLWLVDLVSGNWRMPAGRYAVSAALGDLPGVLLAVLVAYQLRGVLLDLGWVDGLLLAGSLLLLAVLLHRLRRRLGIGARDGVARESDGERG